jgi:hypothetical protein
MPSMLSLLYAADRFAISTRGFDVETTALIREAFAKACNEIHDGGEPTASMKEAIAERLVDLATRGERVPNEMCEAALISLGLKPNRFTVSPRSESVPRGSQSGLKRAG